MGFSILFKLWSFIPKKILLLVLVGFVAYFMGISKGREPYKQAALVHKEKSKVIIDNKRPAEAVKKQERIASEKLKSHECALSLDDAVSLSNIK